MDAYNNVVVKRVSRIDSLKTRVYNNTNNNVSLFINMI